MNVLRALGIACIIASPLSAQAVSSLNPGGATDNSAQVAQAQQTADNALAAAQAAQGTANAAVTPSGLNSAIAGIAFPVTSVNTQTGAVALSIPSLSGYSTTAQMTSAIAAAQPNLAPYVKSVNATTPDAAGNVLIATASYITGFTPFSPGTVASLMSGSPCNAARLASYAVVSDLYGGTTGSTTNEVMRCGMTNTTYYWRPQRTDYSATVAFTGGTLTLNPLLTPPVLYLTGTATSNGTITPSTTYAYPGQQFQIVETGALGLFSLQIGGLLGNALTVLTGGTRTLTYSCTAAGACGWQGN